MSLHFALYISRSLLAPDNGNRAVHALVASAAERNVQVGITGALICTGAHFAQVIEGDVASIDALLLRLRGDARHADMQVVDYGAIDRRRFGDWSMAYLGPSQFVSQHVTRLLNDPPIAERRRAADWLNDLLGEFSGSG